MRHGKRAYGFFFACLLLLTTGAGLEIGARIFVAAQGRQQHDEQLEQIVKSGARVPNLRSIAPQFSLNLSWGFGHRRGYSSLEYFTSLGSPYHYPLSKEEFAKLVDGLPANNWGFQADRDYPDSQRDAYVVGIFGGSVANFFYAMMRKDLERDLSTILQKKVAVLNFALGAAKQPQQAQILTFFSAIGQRLDLILNIDGFNEIAHPPRNAQADVATAYPFFGVTGSAVPQDQVSLQVAEYVINARKLADLIELTQSSIRWNHATLRSRFIDLVAVIVFRAADRKHYARLVQIESQRRTPSDREVVHLPHFSRLFEIDDPVEQGIRTWMESSRLMANIARGMGAEYFEFIQPSQYWTQRKFTEAERAIAFAPTYQDLARPYPRLVSRIGNLASEGIKIYSLLDIFDDTREPIYVDACCHFNLLGNRLIADAIVARIRAEKSIQP